MPQSKCIEYAKKSIADNKEHKEEILEFLELALEEIEEGGSPDGEYESMVQSIEQLINHNNELED